MYPSRFGLTLRQAYRLAGSIGFNRCSVIVSTMLNRHCCMEVNLHPVEFPLSIRPLVGYRYVGKERPQILIGDGGRGSRQGSTFEVQRVFSGSADRPFWGTVTQ